jgi:hypothetical protein
MAMGHPAFELATLRSRSQRTRAVHNPKGFNRFGALGGTGPRFPHRSQIARYFGAGLRLQHFFLCRQRHFTDVEGSRAVGQFQRGDCVLFHDNGGTA